MSWAGYDGLIVALSLAEQAVAAHQLATALRLLQSVASPETGRELELLPLCDYCRGRAAEPAHPGAAHDELPVTLQVIQRALAERDAHSAARWLVRAQRLLRVLVERSGLEMSKVSARIGVQQDRTLFLIRGEGQS